LTVVDSQGQELGLLTNYHAVLMTFGTDKVVVDCWDYSTRNFCRAERRWWQWYYESTDCTGPALWPQTYGPFFSLAYVFIDDGLLHYGVGTYQRRTINSYEYYDHSLGQWICNTVPGGSEIDARDEERTADVSGFVPPFSGR
jgi:hypothetical protein